MEGPKMETMVVPVFGTAYTEFSEDALVYSKTLDQWSTHVGLDIKAEEGSPVRAAMDGVVEELVNDPQLGMTIIISHGGGVQTKYINLSTLDLVTVDQKIKKGDVISGVGKTALYEIADDPHLHFEVIREGKNIDPKKYLPKQSIKK
jgi:murein DD-endopeptidase MepM/ murein hydrolase activator NlpD